MASPSDLRAAAIEALDRSHSPHSGFAVGAAIEDDTGAVHVGANVECVATPLGACAEVTAIGHMVMASGPYRRVRQVAVVGRNWAKGEGIADAITPCGGCRQRLAEFVEPERMGDVPVHLCDANGVVRSPSLGELLPGTFTADIAKDRS